MTFTPNSPQELLDMNTKEKLTNVEVVEKLVHHSDMEPSDLVEVLQILTQKLLTFHANVAGAELKENDGSLPADKLFWVMDATKLQVVAHLVKDL